AGLASERIPCRLGERDPSVLDAISDSGATEGEEALPGTGAGFPVQLTPALIERISGPDLTIPDLRTPTDVAIVERAAALFRPPGSEPGWGARFGRELNATEDRHFFREIRVRGHQSADDLARSVPIVEGKLLEPFQVDLRSARFAIRA